MWLIYNQPARSVAFLHKNLNTLCRVLIEFVETGSLKMQKKQKIRQKIQILHYSSQISAQFIKIAICNIFKRAFDRFYRPLKIDATFTNSNLLQRVCS